MAERKLPPLSEAQMQIMTVIWELGECSVADVLRELQRQRPVTRNTVHTMMTRLAEKGWLTVSDQSSSFRYRAAVNQDVVQQNCVERMVDTVFDGSAEGLLLALLQRRTLSSDEAKRIRRMIREAEERS